MAGDDSDEALLAQFLQGEESAFTTLMHRHEDRVFSLAHRMVGNRSDALDATQDAFISAFRRAHAFRGESSFATWLYRIAINASNDVLRKRARLRVADEPPERALERGDPASPLDDRVSLRIDIARALTQLPAEYRDAVVLHDLGGVPYEEIAAITGAALGTVKSRISRGRRQLAALLEQAGARPASKERA